MGCEMAFEAGLSSEAMNYRGRLFKETQYQIHGD